MIKTNGRISLLAMLMILPALTQTCYALPFSITTASGTTLPTNIIPGQSANAYYTVTNNTVNTRNNNYIKYLPPGVTQVTVDASTTGLCGSTFNLTANGSPGASCILELNITGPVNAQDPNPHHHLFACFPGGITCAGTINPLNVTGNMPTAFKYSYVASFGTNSIFLCSINQSTGTFNTCGDSGAGAVFDTPATLALSPIAPFAYVTNFGGSAGTTVSLCSANLTTGFLSNCGNSDGDGSAVFSGPLGVSINATGTYAYVANIVSNAVTSCAINPTTNQLQNCIVNGGFVTPIYLTALNGAGTRAYISNTALGTISMCQINPADGSLSACVNADGDGSAVFNGPALMSITAADTRMYVSDNGLGAGTTVSVCSINLVTGNLYNCTDSGLGPIFQSPVAVTLNANNTLLYVSNNAGTTVSMCPINATTGLLTSCSNADGDGTATFLGPAGVTLGPLG